MTALAGWAAAIVFLKASVVILLTLVATLLLRSSSAAMRNACWTALGIGLVILPAFSALTPRISVEVPAASVVDEWITGQSVTGANDGRDDATLGAASGEARLWQ